MSEGQQKQISRGAMTAWIVATMVVIATVFGIMFVAAQPSKYGPNDPYADCRHWYGDDKACIADKFAARMGVS